VVVVCQPTYPACLWIVAEPGALALSVDAADEPIFEMLQRLSRPHEFLISIEKDKELYSGIRVALKENDTHL
jgi:hypothetical protein